MGPSPKHLAAVLGCCLAACASGPAGRARQAPPVPFWQNSLGVGIEGRAVIEPPLGDAALRPYPTVRLAYSLSRLSACFRGEDVAVDLEDLGDQKEGVCGNHFAVTLDGSPMPPIVLAPGERRVVAVARGLPGGPSAIHSLRLTKRTEAIVGEVRVHGLLAADLLPPPLPSSRRVWLLGDSITCGYGDLGHGPHCSFSPETEDATLAYSGRLRHSLGASVEVVATSGRGLWQNLDGSREDTVPQLFERTLPSSAPATARLAARAPHAIVINLGTNDASCRLPLVQADFERAYRALLQRLRQIAPDAHVFIALGPMLSNTWEAHPEALRRVGWAINAAIAARNAVGDRRVTLVGFTSQTGKLGYGCDYHPSLATHAQMAQHLSDVMADALGWTQDPAFGRPLQIP